MSASDISSVIQSVESLSHHRFLHWRFQSFLLGAAIALYALVVDILDALIPVVANSSLHSRFSERVVGVRFGD